MELCCERSLGKSRRLTNETGVDAVTTPWSLGCRDGVGRGERRILVI